MLKRVTLAGIFLALAAAAVAQTPTVLLAWDVTDQQPATVNSWARLITIDGATVATAPTCSAAVLVPPTTGTTCTVPAPTLSTGSHIVEVRYTSGSFSVKNTTTGLGAAGTPPSMASNVRVVVLVCTQSPTPTTPPACTIVPVP